MHAANSDRARYKISHSFTISLRLKVQNLNKILN